MPQTAESFEIDQAAPPVPELQLLIAAEPWPRVFAQNVRDLFHRPELGPLHLQSAPAAFWPDVFVESRLPWRRFWQSGAFHILALAVILAGSRFLALQPHPSSHSAFTHADVVHYTPAEYLPPLDTGRSEPSQARKADPEYSAQAIISLPREADNHSQTIVVPNDVKLAQDVALPNSVSLLEKMPNNPRMPIGPAPAVPVSEIQRLRPQMERSVIAPPPDLTAAAQKSLQAPQSAVIAPPPDVDAGSARRLGNLNIGRSSVIAPAPQLSVDEQRTPSGTRSARNLPGRSPQVVAPPPSLASSGRSRSGGGMIALSLHPAVGAPPESAAGNRRGNFATTPTGHRGASGAAGVSTGDNSTGGASAGNGKTNGSDSLRKGSGDLPSGLYVGSVNPKLLAGARPPRAPARTTQPETESKLSDVERAVFGDRKFYSLSLNMPNLNSAGGSWIIRFAALKPDSGAASGAKTNDPSASELSAPAAIRKVDPAYPLELMKQHVGGTVILYGIIHANGKVGSVRVLRSVDERLDQFASEAITSSQFQPAMKNGTPVDVEATFSIPFRPARTSSNF
jgi:periplasmic protein TonB